MILLHTGTNDLETANSAEELVSNILMLITEASTNVLHDHKHILKRHIGLFAKHLNDTIHGRAQPRTPQNHPASPQGRSPLLRHTPYSNAIENTPPHTYHWRYDPQTRPQAMPLVEPRLQQQITPTPHQAAQNQTPAVPHHYPNAPYQTLPHAGKMETARKETHPPSSVTNTIPQESISFLRFVKSFV